MRKSEIIFLIAIVISSSSLLSSCTKEKRPFDTTVDSTAYTGPRTLSFIQQDIFRLGCAVSGCHDGRANPAAGLSLASTAESYAGMVNVVSTQLSGVKLVVPADPEESYLISKLEGTHIALGGSGDRMPQYSAQLSPGEIQRIKDWIADGADLN